MTTNDIANQKLELYTASLLMFVALADEDLDSAETVIIKDILIPILMLVIFMFFLGYFDTSIVNSISRGYGVFNLDLVGTDGTVPPFEQCGVGS